jgi:hypothetical protein
MTAEDLHHFRAIGRAAGGSVDYFGGWVTNSRLRKHRQKIFHISEAQRDSRSRMECSHHSRRSRRSTNVCTKYSLSAWMVATLYKQTTTERALLIMNLYHTGTLDVFVDYRRRMTKEQTENHRESIFRERQGCNFPSEAL